VIDSEQTKQLDLAIRFARNSCLILMLWGPAWVAAAEVTGVEMREVEPAVCDDVLFNPGTGLYLAGGSGLQYEPAAIAARSNAFATSHGGFSLGTCRSLRQL